MIEKGVKVFTGESMFAILHWLELRLAETAAGEHIAFEVLDPDRGANAYAGTPVTVGDIVYIHRGYKAWTDLAELLFCRMLTPEKAEGGRVRLRFMKLDSAASFHAAGAGDRTEKYGTASAFARLRKDEEPAFLSAHRHALERVGIKTRKRILNLGINRGDEFETIRTIADDAFDGMELVGIDHSASALAFAASRFPASNVTFHVHDINALAELNLGRFDLIVSIGTLQSPGIDFKPLFMSLVQNFLTPGGAVILGFPNCRWIDGEMLYGAQAPNYAFSEQSLLYKDVYFCKKYLQQKKYRVTLHGKHYLFLSATPIGLMTKK
jgi:SAM-dependent methyltransferase